MARRLPNSSVDLCAAVALAAIGGAIALAAASAALLSLFSLGGSSPSLILLVAGLLALGLAAAVSGLAHSRRVGAALAAGAAGLAANGLASALASALLGLLAARLPFSANALILLIVSAGAATQAGVTFLLTQSPPGQRVGGILGWTVAAFAAAALIVALRDLLGRALATGPLRESEQGLWVAVLVFAALAGALVAYACQRFIADNPRHSRCATALAFALGLLALLTAILDEVTFA